MSTSSSHNNHSGDADSHKPGHYPHDRAAGDRASGNNDADYENYEDDYDDETEAETQRVELKPAIGGDGYDKMRLGPSLDEDSFDLNTLKGPQVRPGEFDHPRHPLDASPNDPFPKFSVFPALLYKDSKKGLKTLLLTKRSTTLGSSPGNDLIVPGTSSKHALIEVNDSVIEFKAFEGAKTILNGRLVQHSVLQPGDTLKCANTWLAVALKAKEGSRSSPWPSFRDQHPKSQGALPETFLDRFKALNEYHKQLSNHFEDEQKLMSLTAEWFIENMAAVHSFCVLFEEDGENPVALEFRNLPGYEASEADHQDTKTEAARLEVDENILSQVQELKVPVKISRDLNNGQDPRQGLAVPLIHQGALNSLIYFERLADDKPIDEIDEILSVLLAQLLVYPVSHLLA